MERSLKAVINQGAQGPDEAVFEFQLYPLSYDDIQLSYATVDDSAVSGRDFLARSGTLDFASGETRKFVTVPLLPKNGDGKDKRFVLALFRPFQAILNQLAVEAVWTSPAPESPFSIQLVSAADGLFRFQFSTTPGHSYQAERATQLNVPDWQSIGAWRPATNETMNYTEPLALTNRPHYYRVVGKP